MSATRQDSLSARDLLPQTHLASLRIYPRLASTQSCAAALADGNQLALPGAVVASRQTAGRGRGGNTWWADAGSLAVTFLLPISPKHRPEELPLRAGLAVCEVVGRYVDPASVQVKWPNDVLVGGKKIAGVLCERRRNADLVGIGLNVATDFSAAPAEVKKRATSLRAAGGGSPRRGDVLVLLARSILALWQDEGWHERLLAVHALTGRDVAVETPEGFVRGRCEGVRQRGRLLVRQADKLRRLLSGTIIA